MAKREISFEEFLRELGSRRGIAARVRLVARYWREIQRLSAADRERVALALGSEAAWKQLERLFLRDGSLSDDERAVQSVLDRLGKSDPGELRRLLETLRRGDRKAAAAMLVGTMHATLREEDDVPVSESMRSEEFRSEKPIEPQIEAEDAESRREPGAEPQDRQAVSEAGTVAGSAEVADEDGTVGHGAGKDSARDEIARDETTLDETTRDVSAQHEMAAEESAAGRSPDDEKAGDGTAFESMSDERRVDDELAARGHPERRADDQDAAQRVAVDEPVERYGGERHAQLDSGDRAPASAPESLAWLRTLHDPESVADLGVAGRAEIVGNLRGGWASRRAVSAMIRSGAVDVDEALELVDQLESSTQRSWCLGDIVEHCALDAGDLERVLAAAPGPAARRRLARRFDQSTGSSEAAG